MESLEQPSCIFSQLTLFLENNQIFEFQIDQLNPFFYQYMIPKDVDRYNKDLFFAGIFFGISTSIFVEVLINLIMREHR